jgi:hypothetical protein
MQISEVEIPDNYLISQYNGKIDYKDNFQLKTDTLKHVPIPKECLVVFFKSFSPLLTKLIIAREIIAEKMGLKTAKKLSNRQRSRRIDEFEGNIGESIALFEVLDTNDVELLTGQTDKHLDFKLSFISYKEGKHNIIELATTVKTHNLLGKIYFLFVKPFHRYFMKRLLRKMNEELLKIEKITNYEMV